MSETNQDASGSETGKEQTGPEVLNMTATPCGICGPSTKDELMIRCDGCAAWYHLRCVELTKEQVPKGKWYCHEEDCQQKSVKYQERKQQRKAAKKAARNQAPNDESDANADQESVEARRKALEQQQLQDNDELEAELRLQQKERRAQRALERRRTELETQFRAEEEKEERAYRQHALRQKREQIARIKAERESFEKEMAELDKELNALSASSPVGETTKKSTGALKKPTAGAVKQDQSASGTSSKTAKRESTPRKKYYSSSEEESSDEEEDDESADDDAKNKSGGGKNKSGSHDKFDDLPPADETVNEVGPTRAQLAARKGLNYRLRDFTGDPEDWPLFYASYTISTQTCGYMNHENLLRLQDCLKEGALQLVKKELVRPAAVPRVIERLRRHFGRPEQVLNSLQAQVDKLKPPHDLASFVPFANMVAQLCEHMEACDMQSHLSNPLLVKKLVDKIPYPEKRDWVHYKRAYGGNQPALRVLTNWLMEFDEDACDADVNVVFHTQPTQQEKGSSQYGKKKSQEKGAVFFHGEASSSDTNSRSKKLNPCAACQSTEHRLRFCDEFGKRTYDDRMKMVNREKLCKLCLNGHGGQCWLKIQCDVGNCREKHNPLLHPVDNVVVLNTHFRSNSKVMYRIVPVNLYCGEKRIRVLAFLDEGSSVTLVEQKVANMLGIDGVHDPLTIQWTAEYTRVEKDSQRMNLWASGVGAALGDKMLMKNVHTVGKLMLPHQKLDYKELAAQFQHMRELPIESYDGRPEILIGLNNVYSCAPMEVKLSSPEEPIAVRSKLGWTVYGPKPSTTVATAAFVGFHQEVTSENLPKLLKNHNALEESMALRQLEEKVDTNSMLRENEAVRIPHYFGDNPSDEVDSLELQDPPSQSEGERFNGPVFRHLPRDQWSSAEVAIEETNDEEREVKFHDVIETKKTDQPGRAIDATKVEIAAVSASLEQDELQQAENILRRQVQRDSFPDKMSVFTSDLECKSGQPLETSRRCSSIYKCSPMLDENGVLRMDSKSANAVDIPSGKRCAHNEMSEISEECTESVVSPMTVWFLNPPGTPRRGGNWKRIDHAVEEAMQTLDDDGRRLMDEILMTTLAEAADVINGRPLIYLPQDSKGDAALNPDHFPRGSVNSADTKVDDGPTGAAQALRNQCKRSQYLADMWQRRLKAYLPSISHRTKWLEEQKPLEKDDLGVLVEGWKSRRKGVDKGIEQAAITGADGRVRQVHVRTADGKLQRRDVVNSAVLEVRQSKSAGYRRYGRGC